MLAGAVAPAVLLPRQADKFVWSSKRYVVKKLTHVWTCELDQNLWSYHNPAAEVKLLDNLDRWATAQFRHDFYHVLDIGADNPRTEVVHYETKQ